MEQWQESIDATEETGQAIIMQLLGWNGPEQPSPRIHAKDSPH